jgi:hypothetical protein
VPGRWADTCCANGVRARLHEIAHRLAAPLLAARPLHTSRSLRTAVTQRWRSKRTPGRRACRYNIALALDRSDAQKLPPRTLCALVRCARGNDCRHGPQGPTLIAMRPKRRLVVCLRARARARPSPVVRALCEPPMCRSAGTGCRPRGNGRATVQPRPQRRHGAARAPLVRQGGGARACGRAAAGSARTAQRSQRGTAFHSAARCCALPHRPRTLLRSTAAVPTRWLAAPRPCSRRCSRSSQADRLTATDGTPAASLG